MRKAIDLSLPPVAWLSNDEKLAGRNVLLHVRSASVVEILERDFALLKTDTIAKEFVYTNIYGVDEPMVAALHFAPLLTDCSPEEISELVLNPVIEYYKKECDKMDRADAAGSQLN